LLAFFAGLAQYAANQRDGPERSSLAGMGYVTHVDLRLYQ